jgi:hypothetical protein
MSKKIAANTANDVPTSGSPAIKKTIAQKPISTKKTRKAKIKMGTVKTAPIIHRGFTNLRQLMVALVAHRASPIKDNPVHKMATTMIFITTDVTLGTMLLALASPTLPPAFNLANTLTDPD